jgi:hypothetical protein
MSAFKSLAASSRPTAKARWHAQRRTVRARRPTCKPSVDTVHCGMIKRFRHKGTRGPVSNRRHERRQCAARGETTASIVAFERRSSPRGDGPARFSASSAEREPRRGVVSLDYRRLPSVLRDGWGGRDQRRSRRLSLVNPDIAHGNVQPTTSRRDPS